MIYEYALIPDIFDINNYSSSEVFGHCLNPLKEALVDHAVVRDLNQSDWSEYIKNNLTRWHPKAKELIKKINSQNRLRRIDHHSGNNPCNDLDWAVVAENSHQFESLNGVIISHQNADSFESNPLFSDIENLKGAPFWQSRSSSRRLNKNMGDYLSHLKLILFCSNSLMFIDPHIDPSKDKYSNFSNFFTFMAQRINKPQIEIHRVGWYSRDNHGSPIWETDSNWESTFRRIWEPVVHSVHMQVDVFIWDDFHDRYLISDLVGILVPYGFDISTQNITTTWTRINRNDRDDVQREFDPASGMHNLRHKFTIT